MTHPVLQNKAPAVHTELPVNLHPGSIVGDMLLGSSCSHLEGVFGDFCSETVVGPEGFLQQAVIAVVRVEGVTNLAVPAVAERSPCLVRRGEGEVVLDAATKTRSRVNWHCI